MLFFLTFLTGMSLWSQTTNEENKGEAMFAKSLEKKRETLFKQMHFAITMPFSVLFAAPTVPYTVSSLGTKNSLNGSSFCNINMF